jgi:hypothetical protein
MYPTGYRPRTNGNINFEPGSQTQQQQLLQTTPDHGLQQIPFQQTSISQHAEIQRPLCDTQRYVQQPKVIHNPAPPSTHNMHLHNFPPLNQTAPHTPPPLSDSDSDMTMIQTDNHDWQVVKTRKRARVTYSTGIPNTPVTQNHYEALSHLPTTDGTPDPGSPAPTDKTPKPPPIYVYGVVDFKKMLDNFATAVPEETYRCTSLPNDTIKISTLAPETYRTLIRHLNQENIVHHTYQMRQDRAYRVVIRNLHYSVPVEDIRDDLQSKGHKIRNIINIRHRISKEPLSLFYVDLEPQPNNKDIYNISSIGNTIIKIEPPHKKTSIVQCTRCQLYGHTKTYCTRPFACVRCGGNHHTTQCQKPRSTPATCALCQKDHPANYKGCQVYRDLINIKNRGSAPQERQDRERFRTPQTPPRGDRQDRPSPLYADVIRARSPPPNTAREYNISSTDSLGTQLQTFLAEFKAMFTQLINQNSMILTMLSTLINNQTMNGH